ncbi:hypothetical protein B0H10DRAFT_1943200 [Mycena sp. CBHHK59/15]|nr:hypothetical protein B0H10DRAFT_1943200 [Mycena sp. CBHHK59/15]
MSHDLGTLFLGFAVGEFAAEVRTHQRTRTESGVRFKVRRFWIFANLFEPVRTGANLKISEGIFGESVYTYLNSATAVPELHAIWCMVFRRKSVEIEGGDSQINNFNLPNFSAITGSPKVPNGTHLEPFGTLKQFLEPPRGGCAGTMGLAVQWTSTPVTQEVEKWMAQSIHCNLVLLIHAPDCLGRPSPGNVLMIGESNISTKDNNKVKVQEILLRRMVKLLECNGKPMWCNHPRAERKGGGDCLALVLEWMVDIVVRGHVCWGRNGKKDASRM